MEQRSTAATDNKGVQQQAVKRQDKYYKHIYISKI